MSRPRGYASGPDSPQHVKPPPGNGPGAEGRVQPPYREGMDGSLMPTSEGRGVSRSTASYVVAVDACYHCGRRDEPDGDHTCLCPKRDWGNPVEPVGKRRDGHPNAIVRDGYWTVPCEDGCNGTGKYSQPNLPDYGEECRACKGIGYKIVALAAVSDA